ncbi:hypothetical protein BV22DRAFT_1051622 [Leucogyrophana mollusca]|uniref:Uncharacterized protein n=1 Tax=Leucogyrophana mollusca TaxID=85980 RepID=A0ACB8B051_9AGAM|nr:hypothetical protein BV22DRAFT_1051622 [Leucogyrophana mollusca]
MSAVATIDTNTRRGSVNDTLTSSPGDAHAANSDPVALQCNPPMIEASTAVPPATPPTAIGPLPYDISFIGVIYEVPPYSAPGPFYCVIRGLRLGVFSTWAQTSPHVTGVSHRRFKKVSSIVEGMRLLHDAILRGEAAVASKKVERH